MTKLHKRVILLCMEKKLFKSLFFTVGLILVSLAFFACATTKTEEPAEPEEPAVVEEPVEEPEVYVEEDPVEEVEDVEEDDEEYLRSIDTIESEETVTKQEFNDDKTAILNAIAELSEIMEIRMQKNGLITLTRQVLPIIQIRQI